MPIRTLTVLSSLSLLTLTGCAGEPGSSCSVAENDDGTATISCEDGSSVIVTGGEDGSDGQNGLDGLPGTAGQDGEDGQDGQDGNDGVDGTDCVVTDNNDGTATIDCGTSSVTIVTCGGGGFQCDGDDLQVCDPNTGYELVRTCIPTLCNDDFGDCGGTGTDGDVRLAENQRLEVSINGEFGSVCDDSFELNSNAAEVVCRQLGFSGGTYNTITGPSNDFILDDVQCEGDESTLLECGDVIGAADENCSDYETIRVDCNFAQGALRIATDNGPGAGRLEIFHNGAFGTVCDDRFDDVDADVACRQLGYAGGTALFTSEVEDGTGSIVLDEVNCTGTEDRLADCPANPLGTNDCNHGEDVGVQCFD